MRLYKPDGAILTAFFWDRSRLSVIQGPIQSGTSTACCHRIWVQATEQMPDNDGVRRSRWIVTRDTYKELRDTTMETWLTWFPESEWGPMVRSEPAYHELRRPNSAGKLELIPHPSGDGTVIDCEVIFLAIPDPDVAEKLLASYEITGFFRNEAQFCEKRVIDELLSRCARYPSKRDGPGATWHGGFLDMNAPIEGHWIPYMRGDLPMPHDWTPEQKQLFDKPEGWRFYMQPPGLIETKREGRVVYEANPNAENQKHTVQSYLEIIKGKDKEWIDRRVMNKVGLYSGGKPVYPNFSEGDHVSERENDPVDGASIIVGLDFGRDPAAVFCQCINGRWLVLSELPGDNEAAVEFAPRVKRHLQSKYPGFKYEFWGDPRGSDRTQTSDTTPYDIFDAHGMKVWPATTDNNPEMRRSAMNAVLQRRHGLSVSPSCIVLKTGLNGGYHYPKIKGTGMFSDRPRKNRFSHTVEAFENAVLGGGEGDAIVHHTRVPLQPSQIKRHKVQLRRFG